MMQRSVALCFGLVAWCLLAGAGPAKPDSPAAGAEQSQKTKAAKGTGDKASAAKPKEAVKKAPAADQKPTKKSGPAVPPSDAAKAAAKKYGGKISDDGKSMRITTAARSVMIVDDPAGAVDTHRMNLAASMLYMSMAAPRDQIGMVAYGTKELKVPLSPMAKAESFGKFRKGLLSMRPKPGTANLNDAMEFALSSFGRREPGVKDAVIIFAHEDPKADDIKGKIDKSFVEACVKHKIPIFIMSFSDKVPKAFYEDLASRTKGEFRRIKTSKDLNKSFTDIYAALHMTEVLPLNGGTFVMDSSVNEASIIIPKGKGKNRLVMPDDRIVSAKLKYPGVTWISLEKYDLVRIKKPQTGAWKVEQPPGAGGATAVVSDSALGLEVHVGPNRPSVDDAVEVTAFLVENGEPLQSYARLKHMVIEAEVTEPSGLSKTIRLKKNEHGQYLGHINHDLTGYYALRVRAMSPDIQRIRKLSYQVAPSCFSTHLRRKPQLHLEVRMRTTCPRFKELSVKMIKSEGDKVIARTRMKRLKTKFVAPIGEMEPGHNLDIKVEINGRTSDGYVAAIHRGPMKVEAPPPTFWYYCKLVGIRLVLLNCPIGLFAVGFVIHRRMQEEKEKAKAERKARRKKRRQQRAAEEAASTEEEEGEA